MKKRSTVITLLFCIALYGCAVKSLKTSGEINATQRVKTVQVMYDPSLPNSIQIQRQGGGYLGAITNGDRNLAVNNARQLTQLFSDNFKSKFSSVASQYGLVVANLPGEFPKLKVSVTSLSMGCSSFGCLSSLYLKGELFGVSENLLWTFSSQVGQPMVNAKISDELFDFFVIAMLEAMKKDGVITKQ